MRGKLNWLLGKPSALAALVPLIFLLVFFVAPLGSMVMKSVLQPEFTLANFAAVFTGPVYRMALANSLILAAVVTIATFILGMWLVYGMDRWGPAWSAVIGVALVMPLVASGELVRVLAWMTAFSPSGPVSRALQAVGLVDEGAGVYPSLSAAVVGIVHILLPFFVFVVFSASRGMDPALEPASRLLGANRLQSFFAVALPSALPAMIGGSLIAFMMSLGYYATPSLLGKPQDTVFPVIIAEQVNKFGNYGQAAALGSLMLVVVLVFISILSRLGILGRLYGSSTSPGSHTKRIQTNLRLGVFWQTLVTARPFASATGWVSDSRTLRAVGYVLGRAGVICILCFLIFPIVVAVGASFTSGSLLRFPPEGFSFQWYTEYLTNSEWQSSTLNSVVVALFAGMVAVFIGAFGAAALNRGRFFGKGALFVLMISPLIVPWIIPALGLYFESVQLGIAYTHIGLVLGHVVFALPYTTMVLSTALSGFDHNLDRAAAMSGATVVQRVVHIYVPLLKAAVASAFVFAFLMSFTEFVFASFMTDSSLKTMPVKMWEGLTYNISPAVAAAGAVIAIVALAVMFVYGAVSWVGTRRKLA